ncbi:UNVERIFIED_CONTAM: hypothetical protein GTU68_026969 [Idotea baltica]|nr:hypothetical protein [Idotea baltica]
MNRLGSEHLPFVFYTDFRGTITNVIPLADSEDILFNFRGVSNAKEEQISQPINIDVIPPSFAEYKQAFDRAMYHLKRGDSYLLNLTFPSRILSNLSLEEIYHASEAAYKLHVPSKFTVFSPESFIRIEEDTISTYPMKGTINATLPDALSQLINNKKELAEHCTIVDLRRNDISRVSRNVRVEDFRYSETISTASGDLIQTSSKISGQLNHDYHCNLGSILFELLPAGSISGAPKAKTIEIINNIESTNRGNYTGVCGIYDGVNFDSGVMIRYIEERNNELFFRSGGGITAKSNLYKEYQELVDKINVPTTRNNTNQKRQNLQSFLS